MGFIQEFKEFAVKGNALDLAVGLILGTAFNKIVNSLVNDIIMPPIGMAIGQVDFKDLRWILREGVPARAATDTAPAVVEIPEVAVRYGAFVNNIIDFLIVALSVFVIVKAMHRIIALRPGPAVPPKA